MTELGPVARCEKAEAEVLRLREFVSAAKQWRQATESRLRLLDSRGEAAKAMLPADCTLIDALELVA